MGFFEFLTTKETVDPNKKSKAELKKEKEQENVKKFSPKSYDDVSTIIDYFITKKPAIVCLNELKDTTRQRVVDLLSGAIYALGGNVAPLENEAYLFTPKGK